MAAPKKIILTGLAHKLYKDGLLSEIDAETAFDKSRATGTSLVTYLVNQKLVTSLDIAFAAAEEFGVPLVDIESLELNPDTIKLIDQKLLEEHKAIPLFQRGNRLFVALSDPTKLPALEAIKFKTKMHTEVILAEEDKLNKVIERALELFDTCLLYTSPSPRDS